MRAHEAAKGRGDGAPAAERAHEFPERGVSLIRASVPARLVLAAVAAGFLWLAVWWALT